MGLMSAIFTAIFLHFLKFCINNTRTRNPSFSPEHNIFIKKQESEAPEPSKQYFFWYFAENWVESKIHTLFTKIIEKFSSNTSYFIVCEATRFGPYVTIIRPSYESSQEMLATCWDPNCVYN